MTMWKTQRHATATAINLMLLTLILISLSSLIRSVRIGLLIYVVMKQWRLRKAANKLAHFDPRGHHGSSATVPLNGANNQQHQHQHHHNNGNDYKQPVGHKFECEISPSGSRRLQQNGSEGSRGSRGSDSEFNAVAAPGSDGYGRELKPSKSTLFPFSFETLASNVLN